MRFLSVFTAALLSSFAIASPLSNSERESLEIRATTCVVSHLVIFNDNIKYGLPFCQYYVSNSRNRSPAPGLSAQQVYDVCQCIIDGNLQPAARVGVDYSPISTFKAATRTIVQYSTVTTVHSIPVLTTRTSTVTEKRTIVKTVNAAQSTKTVAKTTVTQKVTIAKTTLTQKVTIAKTTITANNKPTSTVAKTTITLRPTAPAKTSTITVAQTVIQKSTLTVAKTTVTANNQNAKPTTVIRTTTLSAIGSAQKTVTIAKTTITAKASGATTASGGSVRTVISTKTVNSPQKTVTVATTVTARASSSAKVSSAAQIVSVRTVTSVKTVAAQTTATRVVTVTSTVTQAGTQAATTAESSTGSSVQPSKASAVVSNSKPVLATSGASTSAAITSATSAATSSASSTAASSTSDGPSSTCPLAPTATPTNEITVGDTKYERFYRGCGYTEDTNNPGNYYYSDNFPPVVTNFTEVLTADQAVQQCAEDAYYRFDDPNQYLSFDLHFISNGSPGRAGDDGAGFWQCVQYFSEQSDTDTSGFFSVANPAVLIAYGYSSGLYSDAAAAAAKSNSKRDAVEESSHIHPPTRGQRVTYGFGNQTHAGH